MKGNPFFGKSSGRLGESIFYVLNGEQCVRAHNSRPQNPRTKAQMAQRVQFANLSAMYRVLSPVLKELYETIPRTWSCYNALVCDNLNQVEVYLNKAESKSGVCIAAPYIISRGGLPSIDTVQTETGIVTNLALPADFTFTEDTTLGAVSLALLSANAGSICSMDTLCVVQLFQKHDDTAETEAPYASMGVYRFGIAPSSPIRFRALVPAAVFTNVAGFVGTGPGLAPGGVAFVHIRQERHKRMISPQGVVLTPDNDTFHRYSSDEKREEAIQSYGVTEPCLLTPTVK